MVQTLPTRPRTDTATDTDTVARKMPRLIDGRIDGGRHAQMEVDLAREEAARPDYGTIDKTFFSFCFEAEKHAFWTRVRGCCEWLAANAAGVAEYEASRDAHLVEIADRVVGDLNWRGRIVTERMQALDIRRTITCCDNAVLTLYPEPMRVRNWRRLKFYPEVLRRETDAAAFLDTHATDDEYALALSSGMVVLCARHPNAVIGHPQLLVALVRHYVHDQRVPGEACTDKRVRLKAKALFMNAFVKQLLATPKAAETLPAAATEALVEALQSGDAKVVAFAARALCALPVVAVLPYAISVSETVGAQSHQAQTLALVEALVKRLNDPVHMDMAAELRCAMNHNEA